MYIRDFILQNDKIKEDRNMDNETKIQNQSRRGIMEDKEEWRMEDIILIKRMEKEEKVKEEWRIEDIKLIKKMEGGRYKVKEQQSMEDMLLTKRMEKEDNVKEEWR